MLSRLRARYDALRQRRWFRWTSDALILLLVVGAVGLWQTRNLVGGPAPAFALPALDGKPVTLASYSGKPVLVVFWAPWCTVCRSTSDNVARVMRWAGSNASVVSVATAFDNDNEVKGYVAEHGVPYTVLLDHGEVAGEYKVQAFPTFYFIDSHGQVKHTAVGYTTTLGMLWRLLL